MTEQQLKRLPDRLDEPALKSIMASIGFEGVATLWASSTPWLAANQLGVDQLDEALSKTFLSIADKLTLKTALVQKGILRNEPASREWRP
jgi:hypothetical protein